METTTPVEAKTPLTGVGGWLAFFCFTLFFRAGFYLLAIVKLVQKPENTFGVLLAVVMGGVCVMAGIQVIQRKKTAIPWAYASFMVGILSALRTTDFVNLLRAFGYAVLWACYLAMSERVKNTLTVG